MLKLNFSDFDLECGTDEAGRGCLAGPVTAAAVISPLAPEGEMNNTAIKKLFLELNDSKQLSEKKRFELRPLIEEFAVSFSVTHLEPKIIDEINILHLYI